ncbi:DUF3667 domain-containing protein [Caulobacter henricii]|uniref:3'-5' exonuclease n=1 Tax=Caulobacter henricii TaxID=69395 RepID=A0A0P0P0X4_9CAUL|nr:DUF3667 domain-containing protein [Caulobacter henricii]ALL13737.1 3'-5' exonuclease [Caulobacter henricii]
MTGELEAAAADGLTGVFRPKRKKPFDRQGQPCTNCGTTLEGWYCHACGQNADNHRRTILHLIWEAIEGMFHLDGRLARTLPLMFFKPGVLAKDYMEGRIARHVPPFRTFLVALLLFIFAAEHAIHSLKHHEEEQNRERAAVLATPQGRLIEANKLRAEAQKGRDEALAELASTRASDLKDPDGDRAGINKAYEENVRKVQAVYAASMAKALALQSNPKAGEELLARDETMRRKAAETVRTMPMTGSSEEIKAHAVKLGEIGGASVNVTTSEPKVEVRSYFGAETWFKEGLAKALENPEYYMVVMFGWAHRLAVLLLPIIGLSLALVYLNKRQYFIYDHLLVATNLLSFSFLTNAIGMVLPSPLTVPWFVILAFWTPINLFQTLRGGYGSTMVGAAFKTLVVWFMSVFAFALLLSLLLLFSLSQM